MNPIVGIVSAPPVTLLNTIVPNEVRAVPPLKEVTPVVEEVVAEKLPPLSDTGVVWEKLGIAERLTAPITPNIEKRRAFFIIFCSLMAKI